ncbi:MAG: hypothetical protein WA484_01125, partial [Solirubrobacteraceae bacterium]
RELRKVALGHLVTLGDEAFGAVVEPVLGQGLLAGDRLREIADERGWTEDRVDVLRARPSVERATVIVPSTALD